MFQVLTTRGCKEYGLTLILLTWTIWRAPTNASKWRMGFNSAFKGLRTGDGVILFSVRRARGGCCRISKAGTGYFVRKSNY